MENISETERFLTIRGDVAIVALRTVLKNLKPAQDTTHKTAVQLSNVLARQPTQEQSLLSIVTQVSVNLDTALTDTIRMVEQVLSDLATFSDEDSAQRAEENVLAGLRLTSDVYKDKTDEELRAIVGL